MKNTENKKTLVTSGVFAQFREQTHKLYKLLKDYNLVHEQLKNIFGDNYNDLKNISDNIKKQRKKISNHLLWLSQNLPPDYDLFFMTFTIADNENLDRKKIQRILTERVLNNTWDYLLNVDFGEQKGRLHFHSIAVVPKSSIVDVVKTKTFVHGKWKTFDNYHFDFCKYYEKHYGIITAELVNTGDEDILKLSRYMTKLVNHSIKVKQSNVSTKRGTPYQLAKRETETFMRVRNNNLVWNEKKNRIYNPDKFKQEMEQLKDTPFTEWDDYFFWEDYLKENDKLLSTEEDF